MAIAVFLFPAAVSVAAQSPAGPLQEAADFFCGTWKVDGKEAYESWRLVGGSHLAGEGYQLAGGTRKTTELLEIRIADGNAVLLATVPDQNDGAAVSFRRTNSGGEEFIFENPDHDFPRKIAYRRISGTELRVRVEGEAGRGFTLTLVRQRVFDQDD